MWNHLERLGGGVEGARGRQREEPLLGQPLLKGRHDLAARAGPERRPRFDLQEALVPHGTIAGEGGLERGILRVGRLGGDPEGVDGGRILHLGDQGGETLGQKRLSIGEDGGQIRARRCADRGGRAVAGVVARAAVFGRGGALRDAVRRRGNGARRDDGATGGALLAREIARVHDGGELQDRVGEASLEARPGFVAGLLRGLQGRVGRGPPGQRAVRSDEAFHECLLVPPVGQGACELDQPLELRLRKGRWHRHGGDLGERRLKSLQRLGQVVSVEVRRIERVLLELVQLRAQRGAQRCQAVEGHKTEVGLGAGIEPLDGGTLIEVEAPCGDRAAQLRPDRFEGRDVGSEGGRQPGGQRSDPGGRIGHRRGHRGIDGSRGSFAAAARGPEGEGEQRGEAECARTGRTNRRRQAHGGRLFTRTATATHESRCGGGD